MCEEPAITLMHDGPDAPERGFRGSPRIREVLEGQGLGQSEHKLVVRGHSHWPEPLAELSCGTQVLNVDARVVILTENNVLNPIIFDSNMTIACIDVGYTESETNPTTAIAACAVISDWSDVTSLSELVVNVDAVEDYQPGQFYLRELPCIKAVLRYFRVLQRTSSLTVTSGVGRPGPSWPSAQYLYDALNQVIPVIGVAKNPFKQLRFTPTSCVAAKALDRYTSRLSAFPFSKPRATSQPCMAPIGSQPSSNESTDLAEANNQHE